ncbi:MAG: hypothetical protein NT016_00395 [Candidatus Aenigmarchaeota archaeon]|nr:hypothetical protein [Candidatus Aenigmarchaeota archaeon]
MAEKEKPASKTISLKMPRIPSKVWIVSTIFLLVASLFLLARQGTVANTGGTTLISASDAGTKAVAYINDNLVQSGTATLVSAVDDGDMYKVTTSYSNSNIEVYMTKDGKLLFVSTPYDVTKPVPTTTTVPKKTCADMPKAATAQLDAFIVANCPYGLQMQRVLAEIVKNIPSLTSDIKVRYIGAVTNGQITSMHGDAEAQENLRQICIRDEQPDKYWPYVACYIQAGSSASCLASSGVDATKLNACTSDSSKGLAYAQADFALTDKYGVSGSPTMIMNGVTVSEFDFGGRTADAVKTLLCCGFTTQPSACSTALTTAQAASSFSTAYASGSGTTTAAANCG